MSDYTPNPRIVDRAVELWVDLLRSPVYDNGDETLAGVMSQCLVQGIPRNNDEETLARFAIELREILLSPLQWESDGWDGKKTCYTTLFQDLDVDYGPNTPLTEAARRSGLKMEFPWKTHMRLREKYLTFAVGYRAPTSYHYPLSDGRWFVTSLYGDDIEKLIRLIESEVLTVDLEPSGAFRRRKVGMENVGREPELCPACLGDGYLVITRHVSRDMALDACEPGLEGQPIPELVQCVDCGGTGLIEPSSAER
jgi:hypothetical protein